MILKGKIAVITGSVRGIGRAIAIRFASEGAIVVVMDKDSTDELVKQIKDNGNEAIGLIIDVTDHESVTAEIDRIVNNLGRIDILVNNAGIIARGSFPDLSYKKWLNVLDVNLNGVFNFCKAVVPHMIRDRYGKILNVSSIAGKMGDITAAPVYGTSKGAVNTFTKSLARQLAEYNINVNAVAPHAVETDMSAEWSDEKRKEIIESIPLKRLAKPEEIAEAVLFLVSDRAGFITGEILNINGGVLMD